MADLVTKRERRYLLREGHLLGLLTGGLLGTWSRFAFAAWFAIVALLWVWSLTESRER